MFFFMEEKIFFYFLLFLYVVHQLIENYKRIHIEIDTPDAHMQVRSTRNISYSRHYQLYKQHFFSSHIFSLSFSLSLSCRHLSSYPLHIITLHFSIRRIVHFKCVIHLGFFFNLSFFLSYY